MPMNDLPPWLSGEQDRGFLAGAQLGISAARTGTDIAATRQQMSQSAELQPFRVAAADIANRLNRQQFDLGTALFPLKVQQAELANQMAGLQITAQGFGNRLKSVEVDQTMNDLPKWLEFSEDPTPEKAAKFSSPIFQGNAARVLEFRARTDAEMAKANMNKSFFGSLNKLSETEPALAAEVESAMDNGRITPEAWRRLGASVEQAQRNADARKITNAQELSRISEDRQIAVEAEKNKGRLALAEKRYGDVDKALAKVDQTRGVNLRTLFNKRFEAAKLRGDYNAMDTILDEFENAIYSDQRPSAGKEPSSAAKTYRDAIKKAQEDEVNFKLKPEGERKQKDKEKIESDLLRAKALLAQEEGRVLPSWTADWSQIEKLKLQEGDEVLVPADPDSTNPIANKGPHVIRWPGNEVMKKKWAKVKGRLEQDAAIKSRKQAEDKAEFERRTSETGAMWMRSGRTGAF